MNPRHIRKTCTRTTRDRHGNILFVTTYETVDKRPLVKRWLNIE